MSPSSSMRAPRRPRDTGFPEPFGTTRNTTLPHPDADLSPTACLAQDDVHADLAIKRSHLPFLHRPKKHKKTLSHGVVPTQLAATPSAVSLAPSTTTTTTAAAASSRVLPQQQQNNSQPSIVETPPSPTASKSVRDSFATSRRGDGEDETPPTSPDDASVKSSTGLFRKLRRHHH